MSITVLVEPLPDGSGFRARTGEPLNLTATGPTAEDAVTAVDLLLLERVRNGWRVFTLPDPTELSRDEELSVTDDGHFRRELGEYRQRADIEARRELGWTEPVYRRDVETDAEHLGTLAVRFRSNRDPAARQAVAREYAETVQRLIASGTWNEAPSPEDELPDEWMPPAYFDYWSQPSGVA